jgi:hypothetical protein
VSAFTFRGWWRAAAVRAVKTAAQAAIGLVGTAVVIHDVPWEVVVSGSLLAAMLSVLSSLAGLPEVPDRPINP